MTDEPLFNASIFHDEPEARAALEKLRWERGPVCPKCGADAGFIAKVGGMKQSHRDGLYRCKNCRNQFTVTVGTIFQGARVSLASWWRVVHMLNSNRLNVREERDRRMRKISVQRIMEATGVTYKTAWLMVRRVLDTMDDYDGINRGFGRRITAHITESRPVSGRIVRSPRRRELKEKRRTANLAALKARPAGLTSDQILMRELLLAEPRPKKRRGKRMGKNS